MTTDIRQVAARPNRASLKGLADSLGDYERPEHGHRPSHVFDPHDKPGETDWPILYGRHVVTFNQERPMRVDLISNRMLFDAVHWPRGLGDPYLRTFKAVTRIQELLSTQAATAPTGFWARALAFVWDFIRRDPARFMRRLLYTTAALTVISTLIAALGAVGLSVILAATILIIWGSGSVLAYAVSGSTLFSPVVGMLFLIGGIGTLAVALIALTS